MRTTGYGQICSRRDLHVSYDRERATAGVDCEGRKQY